MTLRRRGREQRGNVGRHGVVLVRRLGIALGSISMAWLAASLVVGVLLGADAVQRPGMAVITVVLGALIYRDIIRRESSRSEQELN
jgi:hypothetical protein